MGSKPSPHGWRRPSTPRAAFSHSPGNYHGFIPADCKTDNYKVKFKGKPYVAPVVTVEKFHDANLNGIQDAGEETVSGWEVFVTDPSGVENSVFTTASVLAADPGTYTFEESTPAGTAQTASYLDGVLQSVYPAADPFVDVAVAGTSEETHLVRYGNVGLGAIEACKVFDRDGDGIADADEVGVPRWRFQVDATLVNGEIFAGAVLEAGADGCAEIGDLFPGTYGVTELFPADSGWEATSATAAIVTLTSSLDGLGSTVGTESVVFTNQYFALADFGTKGYWHNVNGLEELTQDDIDYVNALGPYHVPSEYFADGDEPFDGLFADGSLVSAADLGAAGAIIAPAGSWQAEVSHFLSDANAAGTHEEQLAQQLLAFIFNVRHRLDGEGALLVMADGSLVSAGQLIDMAISVWYSGTDAQVIAMQELLESFNSSDAVEFVPVNPPAVTY